MNLPEFVVVMSEAHDTYNSAMREIHGEFESRIRSIVYDFTGKSFEDVLEDRNVPNIKEKR